MRLTELEPQWLERDGQHVGVMFRCPHCRETWLTVFWVGMRIWGDEAPKKQGGWVGQMGAIRLALDKIKLRGVKENGVVPCEALHAWQWNGHGFDAMSIQPSLDASKSGHWHGFITNGEVT